MHAAALASLHDRTLRSQHVVISSSLLPFLESALQNLRAEDRRMKTETLRLLAGGDQLNLVVRGTFLHQRVPPPRNADACTNTTGGVGPRPFAPGPMRGLAQWWECGRAASSANSVQKRGVSSAGSTVPSPEIVQPTVVSAEDLAGCLLPAGFSRKVFQRVLEMVDRCPHSVMVLLTRGSHHGGPRLGAARFPDVQDRWLSLGFDVFDELPDAALCDWCRDGLVSVHAVSGKVKAVTSAVLVEEDPDFSVQGGLRTSRAFYVARLHECVAVCKKLKPERSGNVARGWTSVFSSPHAKLSPPSFLKCEGPTGIQLSVERHEKRSQRLVGGSLPRKCLETGAMQTPHPHT